MNLRLSLPMLSFDSFSESISFSSSIIFLPSALVFKKSASFISKPPSVSMTTSFRVKLSRRYGVFFLFIFSSSRFENCSPENIERTINLSSAVFFIMAESETRMFVFSNPDDMS